MSPRPAFVDQLIARPLPELSPPRLTDSQNPPYSTLIRSRIADLLCHPLLESCLHLMNDDLFSAHFLLRKMQEDEWGKWLHAHLHLAEGDHENNAKLWYEQVDADLLKLYWTDSEPAQEAIQFGHNLIRLRKQGIKADVAQVEEAKKVKWQELVCILDTLERKLGWDQVDGTIAYTKDEDPSHKSNVLGEGWRTNIPA